MKPFLLFLAAAALVQILGETPSAAYQLEPISRVFAPAGSNATQSFALVNNGSERVALTISFKTLERDESYVETNHDADDEFLAYPAQIILAPGAKQKVRVTWLGAPNPTRELTYRIIVEQVPIEVLDPTAKPEVEAVGKMKILLTYRGTLYIRPRNAAPDITVKSAELARSVDGGDVLAVTLGNAGNAVGTVRSCALRVAPADGSAPPVELAETDLLPLRNSRVLAGGARRYLVPWPAKLPPGLMTAVGRCSIAP